MTQASLFPATHEQKHLPPFQRTSDTSREAAIAAYPRVGTDKHAIVEFVRARGETGATQNEIELRLGLPRSTVCARVNELERDGYLVRTDMRRLTEFRRNAVVYVWKGVAIADSHQ